MHRVAELLGWRRRGVIAAEILVARFVTVRAPMPFIGSGIGVEYDHAVIAVSIGDVHFVGFFIDEYLGRQPKVSHIVAAFGCAGLADLHEELSVLGKFQDHVVIEISAQPGLLFVLLLTRANRSRAALPATATLAARC